MELKKRNASQSRLCAVALLPLLRIFIFLATMLCQGCLTYAVWDSATSDVTWPIIDGTVIGSGKDYQHPQYVIVKYFEPPSSPVDVLSDL